YAKDALEGRRRAHPARAAISAASAARCLDALGIPGTAKFEQAGEWFAEAGRQLLPSNPHEAMQLFERARECFTRAGNGGNSEVVMTLEALRETLDAIG
ncbi:MAG: hypothetical protein AABY30_01510, partial [Candidatus Thermoplasmatota archaeon]